MTSIRSEIAGLQARIKRCREQRTSAGKLEAQLINLVLKQLRKENKEDRKREKAA